MEIIIDNRENSLIKLLEENNIILKKKFRNRRYSVYRK